MIKLSSNEASWADKPNSLTVMLASSCPTPQTSASAFISTPSGLVLVNVRARGWDLPGGHIEGAETAAEAVVREVREEAGLELSEDVFTMVGYCFLHVKAPKPADYKYPYPFTYQPVFRAHVKDETVTARKAIIEEEIASVEVVPFKTVEDYAPTRTWLSLYREVFNDKLV